MATKGKISELYDLAGLEAQNAKVISMIDDYVKKVNEASGAKIGLATGGRKPSEVAADTEKVTAAQHRQNKVLTEFQQLMTKIAIAHKGETRDIEAARKTLQEVNKEMKLEVNLRNAVAGSLGEARAKVALLRYELEKLNLTTAGGQAKQKELIAGIDQQTQFIDINSDALARQKINVGNYAGSLSLLARSLKGLGGLGERAAEALGVDPATAGLIRQAGSAIGEYKKAMEGQRLVTKLSTAATTENTIASGRNGVTTLSTAVATEASATATKGATIAQRIYNFVVGESVGAMKILRIALASTGVLLVVAGIVALVSHLSLLAKQAAITKAKIEDLGVSIDRLGKSTTDAVERLKFNQDLLIEKMKQRGATEKELSEQEVKNLRERATLERNNAENQVKLIQKRTGFNLSGLKTLKDAETALNKARDTKQENDLLIAQGGILAKLGKKRKETVDAAVTIGEKIVESFKKATKADQEATIASEQFKTKVFQDSQKKKDEIEKAGKVDPTIEANRKAEFELLAERLRFNIEVNKKIAGDAEAHLFDRQVAAQKAFLYETDLIYLTAKFETDTKDKTAKEKAAINNKANFDVLRAELALNETLAKAQKDFNKVYVEEGLKLEQELADGIKKIQEKRIKDQEAMDKEAEDKKKKLDEDYRKDRAAAEKQLATELANLAFTLLDASITRQKNAIQETITALDIQKAKDIEVANQTIANVQLRADTIAVIEARAAAKKEELERRKKELDIKKAKFDKAQAIVKIIQETAIAIISAQKYGYPQNLILSALSAAIGAAQLAQVLAQPIPKYKTGTKNHPGGPAVTGEGTTAELVTTPSGRMFVTDRPTFIPDLPRGSQVFPDVNKVVMSEHQRRTLGRMNGGSGQVIDGNGKVLMGLAAIEKAVKRIPQPQITVSNPLSKRIKYGSSISTHLTRNLGA